MRDNTLSTASIIIRNDHRLFNELSCLFKNGFWLYTEHNSQLDSVYQPFSFSDGISEFLESSLLKICSKSLEVMSEVSHVLSGNLMLYAYPFQTKTGDRYSIGTYIDLSFKSGISHTSRIASSAEKISISIKDLIDN